MTLTETAAALVARSRAAQGLPDRVTDTAALAKVAAILMAQRDEAPVHRAGAPVNNITFTTTATAAKQGGRRGHFT
jgi:hypothetical protein